MRLKVVAFECCASIVFILQEHELKILNVGMRESVLHVVKRHIPDRWSIDLIARQSPSGIYRGASHFPLVVSSGELGRGYR